MRVNFLSSKLSQQNNTWRKYCNKLLCWLWTCIFQLNGFYIMLWRLERRLKTFALKSFFLQFFKTKWMKITRRHFLADVYGKLQWSRWQSRRQLPSADVNFMGCKEAPENNETFKTKHRWSKSSWLLQRVAFLVLSYISFI